MIHMLKKLQNLLFEEEEVVEEEYVEEPVAPKKQEAKTVDVKVEPQTTQIPMAQPKKEEKEAYKPTMQRIDVTQSVPVQKQDGVQIGTPVFQTDASVQHAHPRPTATVNEEVVENRPSIGITVDEVEPAPKQEPVVDAQKAKKQASYEFPPVISPIFGVDDKDMDAVQTSGKSGRPSGKREENVSKVISPMYGEDQSAAPTSIQVTVDKSNELEDLTINNERKVAEDEVPEFSLDDILKVRDEEFMDIFNEGGSGTQQTSLFSDEIMTGQEKVIDQTMVFDHSDLGSEKDGL